MIGLMVFLYSFHYLDIFMQKVLFKPYVKIRMWMGFIKKT